MCNTELIPKPESCLVYSVGSAGDFSFEAAVFDKFRCEIHTFDPTDQSGSWIELAKKSHSVFHGIGLGDSGGNYQHLNQVVNSLGHSGKHIDVFKIDCEGCEYAVFDRIWEDLKSRKYSIGQILVEMHGVDFAKIEHFFSGAEKSGFYIFSKERNHWGCDGYLCVEFSLVHHNEIHRSNVLYATNSSFDKFILT
jgi:hypothetical protein